MTNIHVNVGIVRKKFKNDYRLKVHEDTHNNTAYVCPECGLSLNTKRTIRRHMIGHSDVKKYKCQYCDKEYKRAKSLKIHLISHTGCIHTSAPFVIVHLPMVQIVAVTRKSAFRRISSIRSSR